MRTRQPLVFAAFPEWAIDPDRRDRHTVAAAFALAGLTGVWLRLTAATQRLLFGAVLFGKCELTCDDDGIRAARSACFGTDFSTCTLGWADLERHMATGRRPSF